MREIASAEWRAGDGEDPDINNFRGADTYDKGHAARGQPSSVADWGAAASQNYCLQPLNEHLIKSPVLRQSWEDTVSNRGHTHGDTKAKVNANAAGVKVRSSVPKNGTAGCDLNI